MLPPPGSLTIDYITINNNNMNEHNTIEKMRVMRMNAMAALYHRSLTENLHRDETKDDFLALLVDAEWENRQNRQIDGLIQRAGFRQAASAADIDYLSPRNLQRQKHLRADTLAGLHHAQGKHHIDRPHRVGQKLPGAMYRGEGLSDAP